MKKLTSVLLLVSALALSACGGDSDSSGSNDSYTSSFTTTIANGNKYSCPTKAALNTCKTDSQCKASKCTLTKQQTTPSDTTTTTACKVSGKTITGYNGKSCKFVNNADKANMVVTCSSGKMQLDGSVTGFKSSGSTFNTSFPAGGYTFQCP